MTATKLLRTALTRKSVSRTLFAGIAAVTLTAAGFGFAQGFGNGSSDISTGSSEISTGGARWMDAFGARNDAPHLTPSASATKGDRLDTAAGCDKQDWPFLAGECLVAASGTEFRTASRTVTIEHRNEAENTSVLFRVPLQELALR